jgi:endonuclease-3
MTAVRRKHEKSPHHVIDWGGLFARIDAITKNDPKPYVTRLAERFSEYGDARAFAVLVGTLISLRTRGKATETATEALFSLARTPGGMAALPEKNIADAIRPAAFYGVKAKQLKGICAILLEKYGGGVPRTLEELDELPGVGRKTANLVLVEGLGEDGICVDTHVHRLLNLLGIVKTTDPDATELVLRRILPKRYWKKINLRLVMLGMFHGKPGRPLQGDCLALKEFVKRG